MASCTCNFGTCDLLVRQAHVIATCSCDINKGFAPCALDGKNRLIG